MDFVPFPITFPKKKSHPSQDGFHRPLFLQGRTANCKTIKKTVGTVAFRIRTGPVRGISTMTPGLLAVPTVSKSSVRLPQAFSYPLVRSAYDRLMADETQQKGITDDAMVVEHLSGTKVRLVEGSYENLKVTTPEDLVLAEALLKKRLNP